MENDTIGGRLRRALDDGPVMPTVLAAVALVAAFVWWRAGQHPAASPPPASVAPVETSANGATTVPPASRLVVDVEGAVRGRGVVHLPVGARVIDAIAAAGGAAEGADLTRLDLAAPLADGVRIAVPRVGERALPLDPGAITEPDGGTGTPTGGAGAKIDLNTATAAQLDTLPGIGPALAAAIVKERDAHGPFRSVDDLARVSGIGKAKLALVRDLVTT